MDPNETREGQGNIPGREIEQPVMNGEPAETGTDQEEIPEKIAHTGSHPAFTALAVVLVIILGIVVVVYGTLEIEIGLPPVPGAAYSTATTYSVAIPAGQPVTMAGIPLVVIHAGDPLDIAVNGSIRQFNPNDTVVITQGTAVTSSLGFVFSQTPYEVEAVYQGPEGTSAVLAEEIRTPDRASSRLVKALLPTGVEITPG